VMRGFTLNDRAVIRKLLDKEAPAHRATILRRSAAQRLHSQEKPHPADKDERQVRGTKPSQKCL
jgi:hypothetical protein